MPDLLTHFLSAYILGRWTMPSGPVRSVFYLGVILPDLFSRGTVILLDFILKSVPADISRFFVNFHSPFTVFWLSLLISQFFQKDRRKMLFILYAGAGCHFFLDLLQRHVAPVYFWLFPFSWNRWEIGIFWADNSLYAIPVLAGFIVIMEGLIFWGKVRKREIK